MSIKIKSKWVKDGEVVEVISFRRNNYGDGSSEYRHGVWFKDSEETIHVLTEQDFLEHYKPYEPVYEYKYAYPMIKDEHEIIIVQNVYLTDEQMEKSGIKEYQRLDFTKREREQ